MLVPVPYGMGFYLSDVSRLAMARKLYSKVRAFFIVLTFGIRTKRNNSS